MLFERASEVAGFDRDVLARVANKADQRCMLFRYPQQRVACAVGQQSPFVNGNNGVLKLRAFLRSEQKRFDCLHLSLWDLDPSFLDEGPTDSVAQPGNGPVFAVLPSETESASGPVIRFTR